MINRPNDLAQMLINCTVRIRQEHSSEVGTGFFIAPGQLLTCSHVVEDSTSTIIINWAGKDYPGQLISRLAPSYPDLAIVGVSIPRHSCVLLSDDLQLGDDLYSYGYTDDYPDGDSVMLSYEGISVYRNKANTSSQSEEEPILIKLHSGQIRPGLSGAPLLNLRTGCVCGIVKSTRARNDNLGGRAIPVSTVFKYYNYIQVQQKIFCEGEINWFSKLTQEQRALFEKPETKRARHHDLFSNLRFIVDNELEHSLNKYVSGSNHLTLREVLDLHSTVYIPFKWKTSSGSYENISISDYMIQNNAITSTPSPKYLILSDPGVGKTTLGREIYKTVAKNFIDGVGNLLPIFIDLHNYSGDAQFGTREWFEDYLNKTYHYNNAEISNLIDDSTDFGLKLFVILDSLDEFLAGETLSSMDCILGSYIFQISDIVACRTHFYERYLFMSNFARSFEKIYLEAWSDQDRNTYSYRYLAKFYPNRPASLQKQVIYRINQSPALKELCHIPLRLNMTLDTLVDANSLNVYDLVSLYTAYVYKWLLRESLKPRNKLDIEEKFSLLEQISWKFYEEGTVGENITGCKFTRSELSDLIDSIKDIISSSRYDRKSVIDDLVNRAILVERTDQFSGFSPTLIRFTHKSFQEYFVARYLFTNILTSSSAMVKDFRHVISQEVGQFFKGYINRINQDSSKLAKVTEVCISAFNLNQETYNEDLERARLATQQMGYYMGHLKTATVTEYLGRHLETTDDLWTKRSLAIGLAFSGRTNYLNEYVDRLRHARQTQRSQQENLLNIGTQLSYFGDQPYDELDPVKDQNIPRCKNLVEKLIYQLGTEINRPSWRLDLYTILDVGKYREISKHNFTQTTQENISEFERVITSLKNDPEFQMFPEVAEAEELIDKVRNSFFE